jgi:Holliday junction resolvase RusA-like endonuclease
LGLALKIEISIAGRIPSKKNSKVFNVKMKRLFASSKHREWEASALKQIMVDGHKPMVEKVFSVVMDFNFPDMRRTDLTNKAESVMDLIVKAGILKDDSWQEVPQVVLTGKRDLNSEPGCKIIIWGIE